MDARLCVAMAGRIAEVLHTSQLSTGARNDIEQATELARAMVCDYGMSDLGPLSYGKKDEQIFLGREIAQHRDYSEATAIKIDEAVRLLVEAGRQESRGPHRAEPLGSRQDRTAAAREGIDRRRRSEGDRRRQVHDRRKLHPRRRSDGGEQQVFRPEAGERRVPPGFLEGERPQPA